MKRSLLIITLLALAGCANLKFQWAASYQTDNLAADMAAARASQKVPDLAPVQADPVKP
jgi:hypothetical protein